MIAKYPGHVRDLTHIWYVLSFKTWSVLNHDDSVPVSLAVITALFRLHLVCPVFFVLLVSDTTPAYSKIITTK